MVFGELPELICYALGPWASLLVELMTRLQSPARYGPVARRGPFLFASVNAVDARCR